MPCSEMNNEAGNYTNSPEANFDWPMTILYTHIMGLNRVPQTIHLSFKDCRNATGCYFSLFETSSGFKSTIYGYALLLKAVTLVMLQTQLV